MKAAFHYVVRAKLIRFLKDNEIDFLEFEDAFEDESPILARENAFSHYQNYIDVLLEAKGKKYSTDRNAREELKSYYNPEKKEKIRIGEHDVDFNNSFGFGIGVFMVIDEPKLVDSELTKNIKGDEFWIHGIGNIGTYITNDAHMFALWIERDYYKQYNYETNNTEIQVLYCCEEMWNEGNTDTEPAPSRFLETPFDWEGYEKPYWWGESEIEQLSKTIEELIALGETNQVEFKPALVYNFSSGKGGIGIKNIIAKAICAFLNSNGGFLFIGVSDEGKIQGLDNDFKLSGKKNPRDYFLLEYDNMLKKFLTFSVKSNVIAQFYEIDGKEIFVINVTPNKRRPIFLNGQFEKEFYVRGEASTRQLSDIEEITNYCIDRFTNQ